MASKAGSSSFWESFNPITGANVRSVGMSAGYTYSGGIVYSPATGRYYTFSQDQFGDWNVSCYDNTFTLQNLVVWDLSDAEQKPILGWDHINSRLLVAVPYDSLNYVRIHTFAAEPPSATTDFSPTSSVVTSYDYPNDLGYVARVNTEYGDRYVFRAVDYNSGLQRFQVLTTAASPVRQTAEEWPAANAAKVRGAWYDGTRFWSLAGQGQRYRYETGRTGDSPLAGFSPRKANLVVYLVGGYQDRYPKLLEKLGPHKTGVSCLYLTRLGDVDLDVLRQLIERSMRVGRNVDKASR